jgi:hypothetical protein
MSKRYRAYRAAISFAVVAALGIACVSTDALAYRRGGVAWHGGVYRGGAVARRGGVYRGGAAGVYRPGVGAAAVGAAAVGAAAYGAATTAPYYGAQPCGYYPYPACY